MGEHIEFPEVMQEVRGAMNSGRLRLQDNAVIFRNQRTGKIDQFPGSNIEKAHWIIRARGHCLKLMEEGGAIHRFDGFKETDFDKLSTFISKNYDTSLSKKDVSVKGWNWGTADFVGNGLDFRVDGKTSFEIPLSYVSNSTFVKNEVTMEFHQNDEAAVSLMEMRFHIPTKAEDETDVVSEFNQNILAKADIIQVTGDTVCTFPEVQCLTPRGRYDIKIFPTFMQLHGKTYDYKIPYSTILRLFLLPHRDGRQMFFVVSLDPPIKQGQTRYHFVIVVFNKEDETTVDLTLSEEDILEKYEGKLTKEMQGLEYEIVSRIMKTLVNRKITVPGTFIGHSGTTSIACSYKAATGFLYPLERGFIFVHKPPIHIRFDEIGTVNFARSTGSLRSFDFEIETKSGTEITFIGLEKDEYAKLFDFVNTKKLVVKNVAGSMGGNKRGYNEVTMADSDDDGAHDAYLAKVKREGKERDEDDEDDDESDDSDFDPDKVEQVEPEDEFDSELSDTDSSDEGGSDEDEDEKKARKEKKKQEKSKKKTRTVKEPGMRKKRKGKKNKDPNKPKRGQSAYFIWLNANREVIKKENPGISITDLSKEAGVRWGKITEKSEWEALAAKDKARYEREMEDYVPPPSDDEADGDASPKRAKKSKAKSKAAAASKSPVKGIPTSAGSGGNYKSKEFISDEESESEDSDAPKSKKGKGKGASKGKGKKKQESEPESAASDDDKSASSAAASAASGSDDE